MKIHPHVHTPKPNHAHHSPAKMARELLESRPNLADQPFGRIVSKLARGEEVAPLSQQPDTLPPEEAPETTLSETSPAQPVDVSV